MNKFLTNIILFLLFITGYATVISYVADSGLKKSSIQEWKSWNDIFRQQINDSIVILGSSRALGSYDPSIIEDELKLTCYNLGMNGYTIDLIKQRFQVLTKYNSKPQIIILNMDYTTTLEICKWPYQMSQYLPYMKEDLFDEYFNRVGISWVDRNIPLCKYQTMIDKLYIGLTEFIDPEDEKLYKGFINENHSFDNTELTKILQTDKDIIVYVDDDAVTLFENFIKSLKQENIQVILVLAPYYHDVSQRFDDNKYKFDNVIKSIVEKYNIQLYDYTDLFSNDTIMFSNGTHLSKLGAQQFTKKLAVDIKEDMICIK